MRLVVANDAAPFARSDAELIAERLVVELRRAGHDVDLVRIPRGRTPEQNLDAIIAAGLMDLVGVDRVIGLEFPAYVVHHPDVVIWLVRQFHGADERPPGGPADPRLDPIVEAWSAADRAAVARATRLYGVSPEVAGRLGRAAGRTAEVLAAPDLHAAHGVARSLDPSWDRVVRELTR